MFQRELVHVKHDLCPRKPTTGVCPQLLLATRLHLVMKLETEQCPFPGQPQPLLYITLTTSKMSTTKSVDLSIE
ncbi:hypothetical protein RRG08_024437 [Elysia crispata]|uniref:Uncharacterized protein n=1 Tax=Elysia crispata TaxID=231223 RepID=A0AAE0YPL0_9GAST|nr:hypothetical protein RRG08_024437 [Elysia crispata]